MAASRVESFASGRGTGALAGALLALCVLLGGCAHPGAAEPPAAAWQDLLADAAYASQEIPVVDAAAIFAPSEGMRAFLRADPGLHSRAPERERHLLEALQRGGPLRLEYDSARTRTAAEAFEARAGNCLSLVVMTAALAREMGLEVTYQLVETEAQWSRQGDLVFDSRHVNLRLGSRAPGDWRRVMQHDLVVDFLPPDDLRRRRVQPLDEARVVAMLLNNRAAEHLAHGRLDAAYAHVRAALAADPGHVAAYSTLGVVHARRGLAEAAVRAQEAALRLDRSHRPALANLVTLLRARGDTPRAEALAAELARLEPDPPFAAYEAGLAALQAGDPRAARQHLERALRSGDGPPELHHALARTYLLLGDRGAAERHLAEAAQVSGTAAERRRFAAKLERLQQDP